MSSIASHRPKKTDQKVKTKTDGQFYNNNLELLVKIFDQQPD